MVTERQAEMLARAIAAGQLSPAALPPGLVLVVPGPAGQQAIWVRGPSRQRAWAVLVGPSGVEVLSYKQFSRAQVAAREGRRLTLPPRPDVETVIRDGRLWQRDPLAYPPTWRDVGPAPEDVRPGEDLRYRTAAWETARRASEAARELAEWSAAQDQRYGTSSRQQRSNQRRDEPPAIARARDLAEWAGMA